VTGPTHDDTGTVVVTPLDAQDAATAFEVLSAAEVDGELVDEAERRRLAALAGSEAVRAPAWEPIVAHRGDVVVGYGAITLPEDPGGTAIGDAAPLPGPATTATLGRLLHHLAGLADAHDAGHLEVWVRRVDEALAEAAAAAGFRAARTLGILGRDLPTGEAVPAPPPGVTVRSYRPTDDTEVVRVLQGAYAGTADGGWDLDGFRTRTRWDWFRADDLLVAEDTSDDDHPGRLLGLHWLKRRDATTGEVHNLAIHPDAQGRGLGPVLLHAGLDHLASTGCDEVLLWVDRANGRAVRLYTREGFTTRWDDVAFVRDRGPAADGGGTP
jgi:mycothiol synthase